MPLTPHVANIPAIGPRIFLDDERAPPPGNWLVARDATQFRALLRDHRPTIISFDHDLGCDERGAELPTGQHCMRLLIDAAMDRPAAFDQLRLVVLHSANSVGRANMRGLLESAQRHGILPSVRLVELPVTSHPLTTWRIA
ncbi:cyclic-phosphate processing receiver domain-containing protein [Sphingomonas aerolata]|uniref:cyclic-phosphate processing receiver domain-containing protein n=1 Tax=Sphingomonas aerolata TaxID=185951 RepID=UPI0035A6C2A6